MVQLSDDCFSVGSALMTVEDAVALIAERLPIVAGLETVPLARADRRVAAQDSFAQSDLPPFANSAVDGYAVRHADLAPEGETVLRVTGRLAAGTTQSASAAGGAVRVFTGAPMPEGADTVFMQEDGERDGDFVTLPAGLRKGSNMRPAGEDVARGVRIIEAGRRLRPQDLALAAATGMTRISVRQKLRVGIFSTGDELAEAGTPLAQGAIYESNCVLVGAFLDRLGAEVSDLGILRDDPGTLSRALAAAAPDHDLILTTGGVSTGEEDHVKAVVDALGSMMFWRLAIKPGRPLAMGKIGGTPIVGLPGNPAAVYVSLALFVRPLLARLGGAIFEPLVPQEVRSTFKAKKRLGRREYVRVSISRAADGILEARKFPKEGAGLLTSLTESDGLAELGLNVKSTAPGDMIAFYPHELLWS
jgi:molybdopterin molybdotransferase